MIYLDNSATTRQYDEVTDVMLKFMRDDFGNPSALYRPGIDAEKALNAARRQVLECAFRSGSTADSAKAGADVIFTSGGTEADNMAVFGGVRAFRRYGNRIVTTAVEHPAVLECFRRLEDEGFEVIRIGVDKSCRLNTDELENAINDRTVLVSIMHVNNEIGTVMPVNLVKSVMKTKKAPGILHCDCVQSFGKMPLPESADVMAVSGHKIHGPKGSGALIAKKGRTESGRNISLPPFICGGGQEGGLRSGTENVPAIAGLGKAAEMSTIGFARAEKLRSTLLKGLWENIDDMLINSPETAGSKESMCCPTVLNVSFLGTRGEVILHTLEQDGIYVSTGSACSSNKKGRSHVLEAMGLKDKEIEGAIRFSIGAFNTEKDIEIAVGKTAQAVKRFRKLGSFR